MVNNDLVGIFRKELVRILLITFGGKAKYTTMQLEKWNLKAQLKHSFDIPPHDFLSNKFFHMVFPPPDTGALEKLFRYEVFKMLKTEGKINDVVIENMMKWPPARRAYASESTTTDSACTAAKPYGRTIKKVSRT